MKLAKKGMHEKYVLLTYVYVQYQWDEVMEEFIPSNLTKLSKKLSPVAVALPPVFFEIQKTFTKLKEEKIDM